ncbi:MAG: hypothetical protein IKN91_03345 [Paludibacteraceae bacterium]|nr:hypothetical protein [Paludibacteraceae bacterium]
MQLFRTYCPAVLITLMSLFAVCLLVDKWNDIHIATEDMRIEACVEVETEDFEWDEEDEINCVVMTTTSFNTFFAYFQCQKADGVLSVACTSNKQRLGLVRRYAPEGVILSCNTMHT